MLRLLFVLVSTLPAIVKISGKSKEKDTSEGVFFFNEYYTEEVIRFIVKERTLSYVITEYAL